MLTRLGAVKTLFNIYRRRMEADTGRQYFVQRKLMTKVGRKDMSRSSFDIFAEVPTELQN